MACILALILVLPSGLYAADTVNFSTNFSSGTPVGNIFVTYENSHFDTDSPGVSHLTLDNPGSSKLRGEFDLTTVPDKLYIQINHRSGSLNSISYNNTYTIDVNGNQSCHQMELYINMYTIIGYDITKYCHTGKNEFVINLANTAKTDLWVRQVDISPVVSFVEHYQEKNKKESFYLLIPLYLAYFFLIAITISYLLFVTMWRNNFGPHAATILALFICGIGFAILPFLIFGLYSFPVTFSIFHLSPVITLGISLVGLIVGLIWIMQMHK